jgi:hypothetical protein
MITSMILAWLDAGFAMRSKLFRAVPIRSNSSASIGLTPPARLTRAIERVIRIGRQAIKGHIAAITAQLDLPRFAGLMARFADSAARER